MQLQWNKCAGGAWCLLTEIDLRELDSHGVFVIWRPGEDRPSPVLYVGRGTLREEIAACRRDPVLGKSPGSRVTWATVDRRDVDGVAVYLYQQLRPLWGEVPRPAPARPVNLPLTA